MRKLSFFQEFASVVSLINRSTTVFIRIFGGSQKNAPVSVRQRGKRKSLQRSALIALFWIFCWCPGAAGTEALTVSQRAPGFTLPDLSGKMVSLEDYRGRLVLVDFWATWCVPCRKSLPELAAVDRKYRRHGVTVLGLTVDDMDSFDNPYVKRFIDRYQVTYPVLRANEHIMEAYLGTEHPQIPVLFILDGEGRIAEKIVGYADGKIESTLIRLLDPPQTVTDNK